MRLSGRVFKVGRSWAIEAPILGAVTQGYTKKEAYEMIADAIESLVNKKGFKVEVYPGKGDYFELGSPDLSTLTAFLLRRQRMKRGLTLVEVAKEKFHKLLSALSPDNDFVLVESGTVPRDTGHGLFCIPTTQDRIKSSKKKGKDLIK